MLGQGSKQRAFASPLGAAAQLQRSAPAARIEMQRIWRISPKFTNDKLKSGTIDDKIDVFEDRFKNWFLLHAKYLCSTQYPYVRDSSYAVLMLISAYFEAIESYYLGQESKNHSGQFFRQGFLRVFNELPNLLKRQGFKKPDRLARRIADDLYDQLRCGLFHESSVKYKVLISLGGPPVKLSIEKAKRTLDGIIINPCSFIKRVESHLDGYVLQLRDPKQTDLRSKFVAFFDLSQSRGIPILPSDT